MHEVQTHLPLGSILRDRYVIETLLGQGGFGAVYRVRDQRAKGNLYALKEVIDAQRKDRSRKDKNRFQFEGDILKQLDHRALPRVYRVFEDDVHERAYMLMDYVDGPNLEVLRQQQPAKRFSHSQVLILLEPVADALSYLHRQEPPIIHRDVKPANIIVPTPQEAVLVDFDIAKEFVPDSTTTAVRRCSPGYGAPEQYGQGTSLLTDVYGLGATIYTLLTGQVPPDALHRMTILGAKGSDPLTPLNQLVSSIPKRVANAVQKAMSLHQVDRFPSVEQFWHEIDANATSMEVPALVQEQAMSLPSPVLTGAISDLSTDPSEPTGKMRLPTPLPLIANIPTSPSSTTTLRKERKKLPLLLALFALIIILGSTIGFVAVLWHPQQALKAASTGTPSLRGTYIVTISPITDPTSTVSSKPTSISGTNSPISTPTHSVHPAKTPIANPTSIATQPPASNPTPTPIPTPRPTPTPSPTPIPNPYPTLSSAYNGTIVDTTPSPNISTSMYLSSIRQNKGSISGYFTVDSPLAGSGPFNGSVGTNKYIQFVVKSSGVAPLYFWGFVQSNSSLQGQYCSLDSSGHCSANAGAGGYWNVVQGNSGS